MNKKQRVIILIGILGFFVSLLFMPWDDVYYKGQLRHVLNIEYTLVFENPKVDFDLSESFGHERNYILYIIQNLFVIIPISLLYLVLGNGQQPDSVQ